MDIKLPNGNKVCHARDICNREELVKLRDQLAKLVDEGYYEYAFVLGQTVGKIMIIDQLSKSESKM